MAFGTLKVAVLRALPHRRLAASAASCRLPAVGAAGEAGASRPVPTIHNSRTRTPWVCCRLWGTIACGRALAFQNKSIGETSYLLVPWSTRSIRAVAAVTSGCVEVRGGAATRRTRTVQTSRLLSGPLVDFAASSHAAPVADHALRTRCPSDGQWR